MAIKADDHDVISLNRCRLDVELTGDFLFGPGTIELHQRTIWALDGGFNTPALHGQCRNVQE